jgi:hypothetical protein
MNIKQQQDSQETISQQSITRLPIAEDRLPSSSLLQDINEWITNINSKEKSINTSCFGGDEKKKATKNQVDAPRMIKETIGYTQALADPMEASDHKIQHVDQQRAPKFEIDDDLEDLFGKKEITKAIINQLTQRALTGSMNSNNDEPPRLCTKKHVRN